MGVILFWGIVKYFPVGTWIAFKCWYCILHYAYESCSAGHLVSLFNIIYWQTSYLMGGGYHGPWISATPEGPHMLLGLFTSLSKNPNLYHIKIYLILKWLQKQILNICLNNVIKNIHVFYFKLSLVIKFWELLLLQLWGYQNTALVRNKDTVSVVWLTDESARDHV